MLSEFDELFSGLTGIYIESPSKATLGNAFFPGNSRYSVLNSVTFRHLGLMPFTTKKKKKPVVVFNRMQSSMNAQIPLIIWKLFPAHVSFRPLFFQLFHA